ncbi:Poly granule associated protein [Rubrivivax sp. A210]|uniref:phasin family protein n=1 Tax=Rubrivivax sp. A210 TaxID=2772301 RepID=UPI001919DBDF|nr:phasin family protein [Rubrivivax sp. A210]CAD5372541.1 Poly granule associated protein [Rubrivivax sp. A210]
MVKKIKSAATKSTQSTAKATGKSAAAGLLDSQLASSVKDSAQQIWLAGMGAFAKAQEEGSKVFEALVKEGMTLQKKTQGIAEEKISEVTGRMTAMADTVSAKAGQNWDKLESIFEARTAKAMGKLGVPTAKDVEALSQRVDALAAAVAKLSKAAPAAAPKAAVKRAPKAAPVVQAEAAPAPKAPAKRARKTAAAPAAEAA